MAGITVGTGLLALGFWSFVAAVAVAGIWDGIRKREAQHETLRRMIESGQPVNPALMDRLLSLSPGGDERLGRDLKVGGLVALFSSIGLALLAWFVGQVSPQWLLPILGVSALVACIGIGLLAASLVIGRQSRRDESLAAKSGRNQIGLRGV